MLVALRTIDAHCGGDKLAAADRRLGRHLIWSLEKGRWPCLQQHGSRLQQCGRGRSHPTWHCCGQHSRTWKLPPESFFFSSEIGAFRSFVSLQMALKQFALRAFCFIANCFRSFVTKANDIEIICIQKLSFTPNSFRSFVQMQRALHSEALFKCKWHWNDLYSEALFRCKLFQKLCFTANGIETILHPEALFQWKWHWNNLQSEALLTAILLHSSKRTVFASNFVGCAHRDNSRACSSSHPFRSSKGCGSWWLHACWQIRRLASNPVCASACLLLSTHYFIFQLNTSKLRMWLSFFIANLVVGLWVICSRDRPWALLELEGLGLHMHAWWYSTLTPSKWK